MEAELWKVTKSSFRVASNTSTTKVFIRFA
jgi:hypothetical protein